MTAATRPMRFLFIYSLFGMWVATASCGVEPCPPMTSVGEDKMCHEDPDQSGDVGKGELTAGEMSSCSKDADCEAAPAACTEPEKCQGHRPMLACEQSKCVQKKMLDDDSACGSAKPAMACALFKAVSCNGQKAQREPECLTSCISDEDCDEDASCTDGECIANGSVRDGADCTDSAQCQSGHCSNNICCQSGDCCSNPADCPAGRYGAGPTCDAPGSCQGTRKEAVCQNNTCSSEIVEDDSACSVQTIARRCTDTPNIMCSGAMSQSAVSPCGTPPAKNMPEMPADKAPAQQAPAQKPPEPQMTTPPRTPPVSPPVGSASNASPNKKPACTAANCCTDDKPCTSAGTTCMKTVGAAMQPCNGSAGCTCVMAPTMTPSKPVDATCADCCTKADGCSGANEWCAKPTDPKVECGATDKDCKCAAKPEMMPTTPPAPTCSDCCQTQTDCEPMGKACLDNSKMICPGEGVECHCGVMPDACVPPTCCEPQDDCGDGLTCVNGKCEKKPCIAPTCCNTIDTYCGGGEECVTSDNQPCDARFECHCAPKPPDALPMPGTGGGACSPDMGCVAPFTCVANGTFPPAPCGIDSFSCSCT